jgi:hypothetical protein
MKTTNRARRSMLLAALAGLAAQAKSRREVHAGETVLRAMDDAARLARKLAT